jgi:hypothetical protein
VDEKLTAFLELESAIRAFGEGSSWAIKRRPSESMDDLNRTTNRLRRKFDATANYLETKVQMEQVMDSARRVNQVVGKGSNDGQAQRLWTALRASINDLARCYNLTPMGA